MSGALGPLQASLQLTCRDPNAVRTALLGVRSALQRHLAAAMQSGGVVMLSFQDFTALYTPIAFLDLELVPLPGIAMDGARVSPAPGQAVCSDAGRIARDRMAYLRAIEPLRARYFGARTAHGMIPPSAVTLVLALADLLPLLMIVEDALMGIASATQAPVAGAGMLLSPIRVPGLEI